ncbi:hypothetical protein ACSRUE_30445 [Sorangium sp. KYC3313]|uniref:hypothetical protein n=1 Tax=Sorangium sp. KYC3313 TaxID=3449740 RepID=UPI003F8CAE5E
MEILRTDVESRFCNLVVEEVRRRYPDATAPLSEGEILAHVRSGVERARGHGLTWMSSIASFVELMFDVGPRFDEHPAVLRLLEDDDLPPDLRVEALVHRLTEQEWREVRRATAPVSP